MVTSSFISNNHRISAAHSCHTAVQSSRAAAPRPQILGSSSLKTGRGAVLSAPAELRVSHLQLAVNGNSVNHWASESSRPSDRVQTEATLQAERPTSSVDDSAPRVHSGPPAFVKATGRVVAIGDIHGDLQKALTCLELAGVLEEQDGNIHWVGGDTTVVQLGDVLDRGDAEIATILLLRELDRQARKEGGAVWMLNGNHESLNIAGDFRYVTPGAFWESAVAFGLTDAEASNWDNQAKARLRLYSPGGAMARELAKNPTVLVVNDVLFCHGGLLPHHVKYGLQRINDEVSQWMMGGENADGSHASPPFPAMGDANSVMWNRTFGKERVTEYERHHVCAQLDVTLTALNCRAMVVGHTPQMGGCNCECNGRVWRVDVGMSSGVLNADAEVLEFRKNKEGHTVVRVLHAVNMLAQQQAEAEAEERKVMAAQAKGAAAQAAVAAE